MDSPSAKPSSTNCHPPSRIRILASKAYTLKTKLPLNGDWLFVTEDPVKEEDKESDLAKGYDSPSRVAAALTSNDMEVIELIYQRARDYEQRIYASSDHVRDKAKTLLSTATFVSAILFGVESLLLPTLHAFEWWMVALEAGLFLLLVCHFLRALFIAMSVITREKVVESSPQEFLFAESKKNQTHVAATKKAIAEIVAYAIQSHNYLRLRVNRLIIGQTAFRYGLVFFVVLFVINGIVMSVRKADEPKDLLGRVDQLEKSVFSANQSQASAMADLRNQISNILEGNKATLEQVRRIQNSLTGIGGSKAPKTANQQPN